MRGPDQVALSKGLPGLRCATQGSARHAGAARNPSRSQVCLLEAGPRVGHQQRSLQQFPNDTLTQRGHASGQTAALIPTQCPPSHASGGGGGGAPRRAHAPEALKHPGGLPCAASSAPHQSANDRAWIAPQQPARLRACCQDVGSMHTRPLDSPFTSRAGSGCAASRGPGGCWASPASSAVRKQVLVEFEPSFGFGVRDSG